MRKFIITLITMLTILSFNNCYAGTIPNLTENQSDYILNYFKNKFDLRAGLYDSKPNNTVKESFNTLFENLDRIEFTNFFNENVKPIFENNLSGDFYIENISIIGYYRTSTNQYKLCFLISNNDYSFQVNNNLSYTIIQYFDNGRGFNTLRFGKEILNPNRIWGRITVNISENGTLSLDNTPFSNSNIEIYDFQNETYNLNITEDEIFIPNYLALSENQRIYYNTNYQSTTYDDYYVGNYYEEEQQNPENTTVYYNYDYNEYFIKPYVEIDTINGLTQYNADSATVPFSIYSQSGDEYYPFNSLKLDLRVLKILQNESGEKINISVVDSYKKYSGDYANTSNYTQVETNGEILKYQFNLKDKFENNFISQYMNDFDGEDYAFQLVLYDFWGNPLSITRTFYFFDTSKLNVQAYNYDMYNNLINGTGINIEQQGTDFNSLIQMFRDFMSTILSFLTFLPPWLITLITLGITAGIALRVLGR